MIEQEHQQRRRQDREHQGLQQLAVNRA